MAMVGMTVIVLMAVIIMMIMAATAGMLMPMVVRRPLAMNVQHVTHGRRMRVSVMSVTMVLMTMMLIVVMPAPAICVVDMIVLDVRVRRVPVRLSGQSFRLKSRFPHFDAGAEPAHHLFQRTVAGYADAVGEQFRRHMAAAQMPGETREVKRVVRDDLRHGLLRGDDSDDPAILKLETVAVPQTRILGKIEQERGIPLAAHGNATLVTAVMRQHHPVGGRRHIPGAGMQKSTGAYHDLVSFGAVA